VNQLKVSTREAKRRRFWRGGPATPWTITGPFGCDSGVEEVKPRAGVHPTPAAIWFTTEHPQVLGPR
jgi:hypothetical protein